MALIPGLEIGSSFAGIGSQIIYWLTYFFVFLAASVGILGLYHYLSFTIKATVIPLYGTGKKGMFGFGSPKSNKFKWINGRTAWRPLKPLFNKLELEPFSDEYIYPGNKVFVFKVGDTLIPGECVVNQTGEQIESQIKPVPYYIRNWQSLSHKKTNQEYAQNTFWEQNKFFILGIVTVGICCVACVATIWLSYKFAAPTGVQIGNLADAIKGINVIPGK